MNIDVQCYYKVCVRLGGELSLLTDDERANPDVLKARTSADAAFYMVRLKLDQAELDYDEICETAVTAIVWTNSDELQSFKTYHVFWDNKLKQLVAEKRSIREEQNA